MASEEWSCIGLPACILLLTAILLWPYRFELPGATVPNGAAWEPGSGLVFRTPGVASTARPPDIVQQAGAFTVEVWAESFDPAQSGPARIVSASNGLDARNFMLGQSGTAAVLRLRTTATDADGSTTLGGTSAETIVPGVFDRPGLHHILITDDLHRR